MSGLKEPLIPKQSKPRSPEVSVQRQKVTVSDSLHFDESSFLTVLKQLKNPFAATVRKLASPVLCSRACNLGVIVGLEDESIVFIGFDAEVKVFGLRVAAVSAVCTENGILVSGSKDGIVRVWNFEARTELAVLQGHAGEVRCVSISPDGKLIVSGSFDQTVRIWNLKERKQVAVLQGHTLSINCVSISNDGKLIVSGAMDCKLRVWDLEEAKPLSVLQGNAYDIICLSISSDGKLIFFGSDDKTVRIWDIEEAKQVAILQGHVEIVSCLSLSSDGKHIVSGSWDETVRIWNVEERKQVAVLEGHTSDIYCVSMSYDGKRIVSVSNDQTLIWELKEQSQLAERRGNNSYVKGERIVLGENSARNLDLEERKQLLEGHTGKVTCVSISPDGKYLVSGSFDKTVRIWDLEARTELAVLEGHTGKVTCLSLSSDGKYIFSGSSDKTMRIWSLEDRTQLAVLEGILKFKSLAVSPNGKYVITGGISTVGIWDIDQKQQVDVLLGHTDWVRCVSISPDGKHFVSGCDDHNLGVWDLLARTQLAVLEGHTNKVTCISISSSGQYIVSGSVDKTLRIWDLLARTQLAVLRGHNGIVNCVSIEFNGKHIVSGSDDHTVRIWDLEARTQLAVLEEHTERINCVLMLADGINVVSGGEKTIRITNLMSIHPFRFAFLSDVLSDQEISRFKSYYLCGEHQEMLKQGVLIPDLVARSPILPHYFNSLHICAYYNKFEALSSYLEQGVPIIRGMFGSPLTVALMKNSTKCINIILHYFISQFKTNSDLLALQEIVDDFPKLLACNASSLVPFFRKLFVRSTQSSLPEFIVPMRELPCTLLQSQRWINLRDFAQFYLNQLVLQNGEIVEFLVSRFRWNFATGSSQSLEFLRALENCRDKHILTTPLVTSLVQSKWNKLLLVTRLHTLLYALLLLCLVGITFNYWRPGVLNIVFLCLNGLFLLYELVQSLANGCDYWVDPWNYVDLVRGLASVTWGYFLYRGVEQTQYLHFLVICFCFLRGFTFFRTFKMTRVFVRVVIEVVKEMYAFLVILAYSTLSFGMMYAVLMPDLLPGAEDAWTTAYEILMGTHDEANFDLLKWLCFSAASLVNVIIMLNLLISILGDAYEKAQMSTRESDNLEMLELVIEYESMCFWRRNVTESSVLIVCRSVEEEDAEDEWTGRINHIKKAMEKSLRENRVILEEKLRTAMEEMIQESHAALEVKIDKVLAALQASH